MRSTWRSTKVGQAAEGEWGLRTRAFLVVSMGGSRGGRVSRLRIGQSNQLWGTGPSLAVWHLPWGAEGRCAVAQRMAAPQRSGLGCGLWIAWLAFKRRVICSLQDLACPGRGRPSRISMTLVSRHQNPENKHWTDNGDDEKTTGSGTYFEFSNRAEHGRNAGQ